jgi:hypothetical protein
MPIYNNPAIGQAFQGIAGMFAPPSGSDAAGWAVANAKRAEAKRISDLYEGAAGDPDRQAAIAGAYLPTQSYRALEMGDATTRRGQDIDSGDKRYGTDVGARTALATNAATVAGSMANQRTQSLAGLYGPLNPGQIRPELPAEIATQFGAPGAIGAAAGAPKPLSETEMLGAIIGRQDEATQDGFVRDKFAPTLTQVEGQDRRALVDSGAIGRDDLVDLVMGAETPVEAIGPGGRTTFMSPGAAIRTGAQPAPRSPMVAVNTGEAADGKLRGKLDETEGKRLSDLQATAVTSSGLRQDLDLLGELIDYAPQGPLVGRLAGLFPGASDAGAAFASIVERAAPGLRVEGSGATSDIEFKGMLNSLPQLRNRPEANRLITAMMRAKADINIRRGELVTAYQNGDLDASQMRQRLADLNRQSITSPGLKAMIDAVGGGVEPVSPDGPDAPAPSPGTIVDGHRFRGGDPSDPASWELL